MKLDKYHIAVILLICSIIVLLFFAKIDDFPIILGGYIIAFISYLYLLKSYIKWKNIIAVAWILRIIAVFAFPALSNDIYRFIWDGWLITEGVNPFSFLPTDVPLAMTDFQLMLLEKMNSPQYYSVYPTVLQAIFTLCVYLIPSSLIFQSIFLKILLLGFEWITLRFSIKLLDQLSIRKENFLIYFLNPLVIVEGMGNLHMELIMISGFSIFLYYLGSGAQKVKLSSIIGLSLSIGAKLMTVLAVPFLLKRMSFKKLLLYFAGLGVALVLLFLPLLISSYENFGKGLDLYFQKFEFNASFYYIFRSLGYELKGFNIIAKLGPVLAISSAIGILIMAALEKSKSIQSLCKHVCLALTLYYFLGTTIHPWYTSLLVFLSVFSGLRYPALWSFLAILSYAKYFSDADWYYPMIIIEYVILWTWIIYSTWIEKEESRFELVNDQVIAN